MATKAAKRLPKSMKDEEYACVQDLLRTHNPKRTLEVGLANAGSTLLFCEHAKGLGSHKHVAIDPFQNSPSGSKGEGLRRIREAKLEPWLEFFEDFDYLAMPRLVAEKRTFDFILIDGWHSFDYTLIDIFFADLLLEPKGLLVLHDTAWPAVHKACRFLETHKPYEIVSPPLHLHSESIVGRARNRIGTLVAGAKGIKDAEERRTKWFSLSAYRKLKDSQVADSFFADF